MSFIPQNAHPSWKGFLTQPVEEGLNAIEKTVGDDINPSKEKVLRFLATDLDSIKITILGQDPYPERGAATGRAFEVGTLKSWDKPFKQVSLKNVIRLIYKAYRQIDRYQDIPTFSEITREMKKGHFRLAEPDRLFSRLEEQGVLFLNTCFTVKPGEPQSHRTIWQPFTEKLLAFMSEKKPEMIWFLWGKNAQQLKGHISKGIFYESRHPMMCSELYEDDFLKSKCFGDTMQLVNWTGS